MFIYHSFVYLCIYLFSLLNVCLCICLSPSVCLPVYPSTCFSKLKRNPNQVWDDVCSAKASRWMLRPLFCSGALYAGKFRLCRPCFEREWGQQDTCPSSKQRGVRWSCSKGHAPSTVQDRASREQQDQRDAYDKSLPVPKAVSEFTALFVV